MAKQLLEQAGARPQDAPVILPKPGKYAQRSSAKATLLEGQTEHLQTLVSKNQSKKKRKKGALSGARVMNQEVLDERRLAWDWDTTWRALSEIHLDVLGRRKKKPHNE